MSKIFLLCLLRQLLVGGTGPLHYRGFTMALRHTTLGRTSLDEWSARHRDLYVTTHNTHKRQISMPPAGFETANPVRERPRRPTIDNHLPWEKQCLMFALSIFCSLSCQHFTNPDITRSVQTHAVTSNSHRLFACLSTPLCGIVWTDGYSHL